ncbi:antibiotic biosynthesis monooxygenase [Chitinimonas sp.]|uniref:antibiotic biosynthesis monooxygenase n=1 Tax=Chitinimonas sp. TaxID=1934313 RepID=UPI002F94685E
MGRFVIVAYRPKPGQEAALRSVVERHAEVLRQQALITERPAQIMQAGDGTLVEVFEWRSASAIDAAHANPAVQALWAEFAAACDYVPLASLAEADQLFAEFDPLPPAN